MRGVLDQHGDDLLGAAGELAAILAPCPSPIRLATLASLCEAPSSLGGYLALTGAVARTAEEELLLALSGLHNTLPQVGATEAHSAVLDAQRAGLSQVWWGLYCELPQHHDDTARACWDYGRALAAICEVRGGVDTLVRLAPEWRGPIDQLGLAASLVARPAVSAATRA